MQALLLLVPMLWAILATVIALILYKTGLAVIKESSKTEGGRRQIVLGGSVAIAAIAYVGMQWGTPKALLNPTPAGMATVEMKAVHDLNRDIVKLDDNLAELKVCLEHNNADSCIDKAKEDLHLAHDLRKSGDILAAAMKSP